MTAKKGSLVLLKAGDGGMPETYATVGGMKTLRIGISSQQIDASDCESGVWRELLGQAGIQSMDISGQGIFIDSAAEETVRVAAFSGSIKNYRLYFGSGDYVQGAFFISGYERMAQYDDVERYALVLRSAGPLSYVSA